MVFGVRGITLPDRAVRTFVVDGDRLREGDCTELVSDGGWILPGLVDMHTHPGSEGPSDPFDDAKLRRHLEDHRDAGVLLVRVPGSTVRIPAWAEQDLALPRIRSAGRWLAPEGCFYPGYGREVGEHQLAEAAVEETKAGSGWCKIIGDWEPGEASTSLGALTAAVAAVHEIGGRVAVHCQTAEGGRHAVLAGADSIEHGMHFDVTLLDRMAAQGMALVPTFTTFAGIAGRARERAPGPLRDWVLEGWEGMPAIVRAAYEAGVTVLAGTDCPPYGNIATEVGWLAEAGLPAEAAVGAAAWTARAWLGEPGLADGAPADLVVYEADPTSSPGVLAHPKRIILGGRVIR
ncbi:amidohydrolase family protein [Amycolatopsis jiangsuensis]|uniref:Imidazolonepropionase-like amidohydrolase n=1 Tax=Amycolatopsis jiangsuensis TaxID=1181879 RepID=A0A840ILP2_9PSEU|nr:amidohydrolase family protein [Amycolatopsis jiangsuensis]MBB4682900.1 imidazolonepropionase-like amidohydrolase [Amycolatopsis jiangsuensis]